MSKRVRVVKKARAPRKKSVPVQHSGAEVGTCDISGGPMSETFPAPDFVRVEFIPAAEEVVDAQVQFPAPVPAMEQESTLWERCLRIARSWVRW